MWFQEGVSGTDGDPGPETLLSLQSDVALELEDPLPHRGDVVKLAKGRTSVSLHESYTMAASFPEGTTSEHPRPFMTQYCFFIT